MYSASRGMLYTAPPGTDGNRTDETAAETTETDDTAATASSETADGLAADD